MFKTCKNLISLSTLDSFCCSYQAERRGLGVSRDALVIIKGKPQEQTIDPARQNSSVHSLMSSMSDLNQTRLWYMRLDHKIEHETDEPNIQLQAQHSSRANCWISNVFVKFVENTCNSPSTYCKAHQARASKQTIMFPKTHLSALEYFRK